MQQKRGTGINRDASAQPANRPNFSLPYSASLKDGAAVMDDQRQQQEQDELQSYLWHSLCNLKRYISAETFAKAEKEIGMSEE